MEVVFENSNELFRLINIYRPPYSKKAPYTQSHFLSEFKDFLEDVGNKVGKSLIMGDFNFHMERLLTSVYFCLVPRQSSPGGVSLVYHATPRY